MPNSLPFRWYDQQILMVWWAISLTHSLSLSQEGYRQARIQTCRHSALLIDLLMLTDTPVNQSWPHAQQSKQHSVARIQHLSSPTGRLSGNGFRVKVFMWLHCGVRMHAACWCPHTARRGQLAPAANPAHTFECWCGSVTVRQWISPACQLGHVRANYIITSQERESERARARER